MSAKRQTISSGAPWESIVGYCRAVRIGQLIEVSGCAPVEDGQVYAPGDMAAQTEKCLQIIQTALTNAGASLSDVVRTRMYVTDISQWEAAGRVHGKYFGDIRPASTMVEVSGLVDPDMLVEIEATAVVENS